MDENTNQSAPEAPATPAPAATQQQDPGKVVAIVSYLSMIGFAIALYLNIAKGSKLAAFHLRQNLGFALIMSISCILLIIPVLGMIVVGLIGLAVFILWIIGLISAIQGQEKPVPLVGEKIQEVLKKSLFP